MKIDPAATALVVVDMQNDFCHADGYYAKQGRDVSRLAQAVGPLADFLSVSRRAGMNTVYTRLLYGERGPMEARHKIVPARWTAGGERLVPGSWGADIVDALRPVDGDLVIDKEGYSAFEGTTLERDLKAHGIRTLLISGIVDYACVLATAFGAFDRDFDVLMLADAVANWGNGMDGVSTRIVDLLLGRIVTSTDLEMVALEKIN